MNREGDPLTKKILNKYKVQKRIWARWGPISQALFNRLHDSIGKNQGLMHCGPDLSEKEWKTLTWNAAWLAANELHRLLKEPEK